MSALPDYEVFDAELTRTVKARDDLAERVRDARTRLALDPSSAKLRENAVRLDALLTKAQIEVDKLTYGVAFTVAGERAHPMAVVVHADAAGSERLKAAVEIAHEQIDPDGEYHVDIEATNAHEALLRQELHRLHRAIGVAWPEDKSKM